MGIEAHTQPISKARSSRLEVKDFSLSTANVQLEPSTGARIQSLTPPNPVSWYTNQLFSSCKHLEASGSLS